MPPSHAPSIFRILLPARDLEASRRFYETLLGVPGRRVAEGRYYFDAGPVIVGVLDYSQRNDADRVRPAEAIYFSTHEIETVHRRAQELSCLSRELLHGDAANPMGEVIVRPWGERSFYVNDPDGSSLCFVDANTLFTGTPQQVEALQAQRSPSNPRGSV